jgi:hypothetical protein
VYDFLTLFDFANPDLTTGNRVTTTVPTQAMLMMNSSLVNDAAARVADKVLDDSSLHSDSARIQSLYRILYSRPPVASEESIAATFIADYSAILADENKEDTKTAWTKLCHVLLAGSEFIYLR